MKEKFTQGEWVASSGGARRFYGDSDITSYSVSTAKSEIAGSVYLESNGIDLDEAYANANLIAAAPEMYRLLVDMSKSIDHCGDEIDTDFMRSSIEKLLTKARGEDA